ncbi:hypothetical protein [Gilliamella sp. wkB112]|uniref:hypothetical protein n=1 Tax=Gilliamella sp. wkB112 TaxID=3120257 RepID=UPI00080EB444|nr:hypothetical protein [Gilliamella apicola]OCG00869.1 hypothetical protein A9G12_03665 [Gilliamella apicola]
MKKLLVAIENCSIQIVESLRLANGINETLSEYFVELLEEIYQQYSKSTNISKSIIFNLITVRDNLIGSLNYYSGENKIRISNLNSQLELYLEKILLG